MGPNEMTHNINYFLLNEQTYSQGNHSSIKQSLTQFLKVPTISKCVMIINVDIRNKSSLRMHSSVIIFEKVNECSCTTLLMNIIAAVVVVVVGSMPITNLF